ncbi:ester cyclase [Actinopolyspora mortivallis]|uniref:Ester cyclase n=1 Tax=Actinopolyspora mortivallis TaxID=33906 RepID=A0A2T0GUM9_ACTMO|nr:ester cyclase [Actinopolyspora mortivallis]PRW62826.1 hypothetical protein CEP50_13375 [Actinopolyspora mortivallis]
MTEHTPGGLYRRWLHELWSGERDHERVATELVTPDFAIHHGRIRPGGAQELSGPSGLVELVRQGRAPFSELAFDIEVGPVVEGDLLCARWCGRGRYAGGVPGASAPVGTAVEFSGNEILRFREGRFVEYWVCSDGPWLMEQLGVT